MAALAHKTLYLALDDHDVSTHVIEIEIDLHGETHDVTSGSTTTHRQYAAGMLHTRYSVTLAYDIETVASYIGGLRPGRVIGLDYGIEGTAAGKPRHKARVLVTRVQLQRDRAKSLVNFRIEAINADAPQFDAWAGGVYS